MVNIFKNPNDQALFVYSKNCHGCKKFLPVYEELAKTNLQENMKGDMIFNRINNDENNSILLDYYWSTPKLLFLRENPFHKTENVREKKIVYEYRAS